MVRTTKTKKTESRVLDDTATGDDRIAYELIRLFAGAMQALNGGCLPLPAHWKKCLEKTLKNKGKAGAPRSPEVQRRGLELAKEQINAAMENRRPFLKNLSDNKNTGREYLPHLGNATAELLTEKKVKQEQENYEQRVAQVEPIKKRISNGESLDDILFDSLPADLFGAVWNHKEHGCPLEGHPPPYRMNEREKACAWVSRGMNLHIREPDSYNTFILEDERDREIVRAAIAAKKKTPNTEE